MFETGSPPAIPALTDWKGALRRPGAEDMRHLRALWEMRPFHLLDPQQGLVACDNPRDGRHVRAALARNRSFALVYIPVPGSVSIRLDRLEGESVSAWWFNPRDGSRLEEGILAAGGEHVFSSPGRAPADDWVLVLDALK
jgi:hypothetical protein